jgi:hypothetical protein
MFMTIHHHSPHLAERVHRSFLNVTIIHAIWTVIDLIMAWYLSFIFVFAVFIVPLMQALRTAFGPVWHHIYEPARVPRWETFGLVCLALGVTGGSIATFSSGFSLSGCYWATDCSSEATGLVAGFVATCVLSVVYTVACMIFYFRHREKMCCHDGAAVQETTTLIISSGSSGTTSTTQYNNAGPAAYAPPPTMQAYAPQQPAYGAPEKGYAPPQQQQQYGDPQQPQQPYNPAPAGYDDDPNAFQYK